MAASNALSQEDRAVPRRANWIPPFFFTEATRSPAPPPPRFALKSKQCLSNLAIQPARDAVVVVKMVKLEVGDEELKSIALTQLVKKLANRLSDGTSPTAAFEYLEPDFNEWVDIDDPQSLAGVSCIKIRVKAPQKAAEEVLFSVLCAFLLTHLPCVCWLCCC